MMFFQQIRRGACILLALACLGLLAGCGTQANPWKPTFRSRAARYDFPNGPYFVRLKNSHILFYDGWATTQGHTNPVELRPAEITGIRFDRAFGVNQLTIVLNHDKGLSDLTYTVSTPVRSADDAFANVKTFLKVSVPHLTVHSSLDLDSASGPIKVGTVALVGLILGLAYGGGFGYGVGVAMLVLMGVCGLWSLYDSDLIRFTLMYGIQTHASELAGTWLPGLMALTLIVWLIAQAQREKRT